MRLVGVTRVSSEEQVEGISLQAQRERLETFAATEGHDLIKIFEDAGFTAGNLDRPGLRAALARIDADDADGLVVARLDRLTRRIRDWAWLVDGYFGPPRFVPLVVVASPVELGTAAGRMVAAMQVVVSEYELDNGRERTTEAVRHKRSRGHVLGHAPYGSQIGPDGQTLVPNLQEQEVIARMLTWDSWNWTLRGIADALNAAGIPARRGGLWRHPVVGRILRAAKK